MAELQLWIQSGDVKYGDDVAIVCERQDCAGPELYAAIVTGAEPRGVVADGKTWDRMAEVVMAEVGNTLASVPGFALSCDGKHVEWDVVTQTLTSTAGTATSSDAEHECRHYPHRIAGGEYVLQCVCGSRKERR